MFKLIELTAEVLGMTADNADGTSRQTHALGCRPGDELLLVPLPLASAESAPVVAIISARGDQIGHLPAGIAEAAGAVGGDVEGFSRRWTCRVVRVIRDLTLLRTIVRLEERPAEVADQVEVDRIDRLRAGAERFISQRAAGTHAR